MIIIIYKYLHIILFNTRCYTLYNKGNFILKKRKLFKFRPIINYFFIIAILYSQRGNFVLEPRVLKYVILRQRSYIIINVHILYRRTYHTIYERLRILSVSYVQNFILRISRDYIFLIIVFLNKAYSRLTSSSTLLF